MSLDPKKNKMNIKYRGSLIFKATKIPTPTHKMKHTISDIFGLENQNMITNIGIITICTK